MNTLNRWLIKLSIPCFALVAACSFVDEEPTVAQDTVIIHQGLSASSPGTNVGDVDVDVDDSVEAYVACSGMANTRRTCCNIRQGRVGSCTTAEPYERCYYHEGGRIRGGGSYGGIWECRKFD